MKAVNILAAVLTSVLPITASLAASSPVGLEALRCAQVTVSPPIEHRGRVLIEIPDIPEPELRLANQLMSAGCLDKAGSTLEQFQRQYPDSRNARFVAARYAWHVSTSAAAERIIQEALRAHPDFTSATVLLAHIRYSKGRADEALELLDVAASKAPDDLWVFLGKLRAEAMYRPSRDLHVQLLEILRNPAFPPNAREEAGDLAAHIPGLTYDDLVVIYRESLKIDSSTPAAYKAQNLAVSLSEGLGRHAETRALLESPGAVRDGYLNSSLNRILLAQAYLMEAARVGAEPMPANEHLIQKAANVLRGDFTGLLEHVMSRPQYKDLQPFLASLTHPEEFNDVGRTPLCNAVIQLNVAAVEAQLNAGADPNGACETEDSLVGYLVFMATNKYVERRQGIMRLLLEHGAKPVKLDACRSPSSGNCSRVLLPLLEQHSR
jgi:tetratricopeptide (TPR) repeat protein